MLSSIVNVSTGLLHPNDMNKARELFSILHSNGEVLTKSEVSQSAVSYGWSGKDAGFGTCGLLRPARRVRDLPRDDSSTERLSLTRMHVEMMLDWLDGHYAKRPEFEEVRRLLAEQTGTATA
jgi:hypothetical protein